MGRLVLAIGLLLAVDAAARDQYGSWRRNTTKHTIGRFTYYVRTPPGFDRRAPRRYPLLVILHWSHVKGPAYIVSWRKDATDHELLLAAPSSLGGATWIERDGINIERMLTEIKRDYPVDEDRVWLAGYSAGGVFVYHMLFRYPHLFDAVLPLGGKIGRHHRFAPKEPGIFDTRVCVFHGVWDRNIPMPEAEKDVAFLRSRGYRVEFHRMARFGHWIPRDKGAEMIGCLYGPRLAEKPARSPTRLLDIADPGHRHEPGGAPGGVQSGQ